VKWSNIVHIQMHTRMRLFLRILSSKVSLYVRHRALTAFFFFLFGNSFCPSHTTYLLVAKTKTRMMGEHKPAVPTLYKSVVKSMVSPPAELLVQRRIHKAFAAESALHAESLYAIIRRQRNQAESTPELMPSESVSAQPAQTVARIRTNRKSRAESLASIESLMRTIPSVQDLASASNDDDRTSNNDDKSTTDRVPTANQASRRELTLTPSSAGQRSPFYFVGEASFYAGEFLGRNTSNGELYDGSELTAAHRELPFGALVQVKNLKNGKSIVVRINDRGPFKMHRILDLSPKAAEMLNMTRDGIAKVECVVLRGSCSSDHAVQIAQAK
jgi:rare lipoprotein A